MSKKNAWHDKNYVIWFTHNDLWLIGPVTNLRKSGFFIRLPPYGKRAKRSLFRLLADWQLVFKKGFINPFLCFGNNWLPQAKKRVNRPRDNKKVFKLLEQLKDQNIKTICMFYCLSKKNTCQDQIGSFICYALTTMFVAQRRKRGKPL